MDWMLLKHFPNRTLEELDGMDFNRWLRATEAGGAERIERLRAQQIAGKAKPTPEEWAAIKEHEALYAAVRDV